MKNNTYSQSSRAKRYALLYILTVAAFSGNQIHLKSDAFTFTKAHIPFSSRNHIIYSNECKLYSLSTSTKTTTNTISKDKTTNVVNIQSISSSSNNNNQEEILTKEQHEYLSSLSEEIYGRTFLLKLQQLLVYKNKKGSCSVPKRYKDNPSLGNWVNKTRQMYRKYRNGESSSITKERIQVLNDVGFIWSGTMNYNNYEDLDEHSTVEQKIVNGDNVRQLTNDISGCRSTSSSSTSSASSTSTRRYNNITIQDHLWMNQYKTLKEYWVSNNKSYSNLKTSQNSKLNSWVGRQRREYQNKKIGQKTTMTNDRIRLLEEIEFDWSPRETNWNIRIQELLEYKKRYGDCLVPVHYEHNPRLGRWVSTQRKYYKMYKNGNTSRITKEKIKQLTDIGFVWNRWEHNWSDNGCFHS